MSFLSEMLGPTLIEMLYSSDAPPPRPVHSKWVLSCAFWLHKPIQILIFKKYKIYRVEE